VASVVLCATASATDVLNVNSQVLTTDPTQLGRLSRNAIPQDWSGTEAYPGEINTTTTYHYTTFTIAASVVALGPFMQISLFDLGPVASQGNIFVSAYVNSYLPASKSTNWLGDAGFSGNNFGNAVFFQVLVPAGGSLVVVVTNTAAGNVGTGEPFNLLVESFSDNQYSPARLAAAPEGGATVLLLSMGVAGLFLLRRHLRSSI
jgi:hypothetical protein